MSTVSNPPTHKDGTFAKQKAMYIGRRLSKSAVDLGHQLGGEALIGIKMQHPLQGQRKILLSPVPLRGILFKRMFENRSSGCRSDFSGSVRASRIQDKHFTI